MVEHAVTVGADGNEVHEWIDSPPPLTASVLAGVMDLDEVSSEVTITPAEREAARLAGCSEMLDALTSGLTVPFPPYGLAPPNRTVEQSVWIAATLRHRRPPSLGATESLGNPDFCQRPREGRTHLKAKLLGRIDRRSWRCGNCENLDVRNRQFQRASYPAGKLTVDSVRIRLRESHRPAE